MVSPISLSLMRPGGTNLGWLVRGPDGALPYMQAQYDLDRGWFNGKAYGTLSAFNAAASGTFSRASDGSYFGADGLLKTAGPNVLRLTHDPVTGKALGALMEGSATNLVTQSDGDASTYPSKGLVTDAPNAIPGFSNAIAFDSSGGTSYAYKSATFVAGTTYAMPCYVKMDDGGAPVPSTSTTTGDFRFLVGGVIPDTFTVVPVGGGVYRVSATVVAVGGTSTSGIAKYAGQAARKFKATGYQIEAGPFATSYIKTTTAAGQRFADSLSYAMAGTPEGTVVIEGRAAPGLGSQVLWQWDDDSEANRYRIIRDASGNARLIVTTGGTDNVNLDMGALANNTDYRIAASFKSGAYAASLSGAAAATSSYAGSLPSVSKMRVGQSKTGDQASATIARTIDFTKAYTAAQVAGMSAP